MSTIGGRNNFGLFTNGDFRNGNTNFSFGTFDSINQYTGNGCISIIGGGGGDGFSDEYVPIDSSKTYQMIVYAKTIKRSSGGSLAGGHIGFATYDKKHQHISIAQCGGIANTFLTRTLNAGDEYIYVNDINFNQWSLANDTYYFKYILIYPPTHPDYNIPYQYTRIGSGDFNIMYNEKTDIGGGEIRLKLCDSNNNPITFPNIGYATPINTPICNGVDGSSYCYALGNPEYPETWTKFSTPPFTGESRSGSYPFRYGTKYIKFLVLKNYNHNSEVPQDCVWGLDNIFFGIVEDNKDYRNIDNYVYRS